MPVSVALFSSRLSKFPRRLQQLVPLTPSSLYPPSRTTSLA
jgi:hypothetical protein